MEGFDLTKFQEDGEDKEKIRSIMGKILSGRDDYEAIIEERKDVRRCLECNWALEGGEKFCPECGKKC
jgi:rRNA maturation endonuclease Nob1|tara:strand:+ start:38 stop:241 length:204 start_codon:yes stop_codon:yes gene_type:complete